MRELEDADAALRRLSAFATAYLRGDAAVVDAEKQRFREFVLSAGYPTMFKFPFVGGYLVAVVLLINLLAAHFQRFVFSKKKNTKR